MDENPDSGIINMYFVALAICGVGAFFSMPIFGPIILVLVCLDL